MFIKEITIDNWKCFNHLHLDFSTIEIFSFSNGSGKTAVLEAINYGMWGKLENKLVSYQNHEGQTSIILSFEVDDHLYEIHREFPKTMAVLYKDGEEFRKGIKECFEYMDSLVPYSLVKRLWFKGDIAESEVLDFKFFKNEILGDKLKDPSELYEYYTRSVREKNREMKGIAIRDDIPSSTVVIDEEINSLQKRLKKRSGVNDLQYMRAVQVKKDKEELDSLQVKNLISREDISKWKSINVLSIQAKIEAEKNKFVDETLRSINSSTLKSALNANNHHHKCIFCNGEWTEERKNYISSILEKGFRSDELIDSLEKSLEFKNSISQEDIDLSERHYALSSKVNSMPNYEKIISEYNKENDRLWDELDSLNKQRDEILLNNERVKRHNEIASQAKKDKEKAVFLKDYLDKATAYYTKALLDKSNDILSGINEDYSNLSVSAEDNSIEVDVKGKTLLVKQLSRGERTMVAMSLIYSIRDIFTPSMPLIFDESFASLSEDNNSGVISLVKESTEQLFVVTHNKDWVSAQYYPNTNVRTSWE